MTTPEELEFQEGDELAAAGDTAALNYGWWAWGWIERQARQSGADPESRAAFSFALDRLGRQHKKWLSDSQITDRIRVGRAFPREMYKDLVEELHYTPSFSQLRAAYVRDDEPRTMELLLMAAERDLSPAEIYALKMGREEESETDKAWRNLADWAEKYRFRSGGQDRRATRLASSILAYHLRTEVARGFCKLLAFCGKNDV